MIRTKFVNQKMTFEELVKLKLTATPEQAEIINQRCFEELNKREVMQVKNKNKQLKN